MGVEYRLSPEEKVRIEEMLQDRCSYAEIGDTLGIHPKTVEKHFPGRGWTRQEIDDHLRTLRQYKGVLDG